jgi:DNA-binding response OmpR family regulator
MKKILIAEDDKFLANAYRMEISKFGYEVSIVSDGEEFLKQLDTFKPDLTILDLVMPTKDGFSVLIDMKKNPKWKSIPVIVATNLDQKEDVKKCQEFGVADYIMKNKLSFERLHEKIKSIVRE